MSEQEVGAETREFGFATRAVHAGARPEPTTGARATPIFQTTSYVFEDPEAAAAYFNLQEYGNTYSRIMNPTVAAFEERIANLEGGVGAVAFASGLAAQAGAFFTALQPGDHVVASRALYGGTLTQIKHLERKLGFGVTFVDPDDPGHWKEAVRPETRLFFGETIGNPGGNVLDIEAVAEIAHRHGVPLMVDSTFATPYLCRPSRVGRRHRGPFDDEVHRRPREQHRRRGGRVGPVPLGQRQVSGNRGSVPGVPRPRVPGDLRRVRIPDEAARRNAARPRGLHVSVQRLPLRAGRRDAAAPDGAAHRERSPDCDLPHRTARGRRGGAPGTPRKPLRLAGREVPSPRSGARCSPST